MSDRDATMAALHTVACTVETTQDDFRVGQLTDRARDRMRRKADGGLGRATLTGSGNSQPAIESAEQALALDEALTRLEQNDVRAARVIELRYFAGLSPERIAEVLGLARRTVDRDGRYARAFLHAALE